MEGQILKVVGREEYLNTGDLADLEGAAVRLYLNPAGCGLYGIKIVLDFD